MEKKDKTKMWIEKTSAQEKIEKSMAMIVKHGGHDGEHHKSWCLDQVFKILSAEKYEEMIKEIRESGYEWDHGIPP